MQFRIGIGHDTHRLEPGPKLILGGLEIPHDRGCIAHSDGDVLLHALIDAILGALAWGDIGEWFPDTDPAYRGADSQALLRPVLDRLAAEGWQIGNVDSIVFAQQPKLSLFKHPLRERLAEILALSVEQVSVKAKTGEKVGPVGREEAICAEVIVLLQRMKS